MPVAEPNPAVLDLENIDYSAFDSPVKATDVTAFRERATAQKKALAGHSPLPTEPNRLMTIGLLVFFALGFLATLVQFVVALVTRHGAVTGVVTALPLIFGFLTLAFSLQVVREFADKHWGKRAQLPQFARDNGLEFRSASAGPGYPGIVFRQGDTRTAIDRLTSTTGRYFDLGNYEYWVRSGRSRMLVRWGYVALRLDRKLPNMLLIAKSNQGLGGSDLPGTFAPDQVLSLEGDFDKYFTLYCPKRYETDALYVFTPDLMALLIDNAQAFDVEIVDDWMFIVVRKPFPAASVATYELLFRIIRTVGAKTLSQTKNYSDAQVGSYAANIVAPQALRLRRNVSPGRVLIMVVVLAMLFAIPTLALLHR